MSDAAGKVTQILESATIGDAAATDELLPIVYDELRQLAAIQLRRERSDHTLRPTDLVHEVYLKLLGDGASWENRRHFFGAAAEAMRRILIDHARHRNREKRGGNWSRVELEYTERATKSSRIIDLMVLDEALCRMEKEDPRMAEVVKLRFFGGLSIDDTARAMGLSSMTVIRAWRCARAWLHVQIAGEDDDGEESE
jgi:RNA polymerase sigma factor (TIGR02999 family)